VNEKVKKFVLDYLQRHYSIKNNEIMKLRYIDEGYIDSMGLILFISNIETEFNIEFSVDELSSNDFGTIGGLIKIISLKFERSNNNEES
jgi:acyl carrier protein